jgi:hypothetical protein
MQSKPWLTRDKAMIDQLKSIDIEKGKPFSPDPATQAIFNASAGEARAWLDLKYETAFSLYYEGGRWVFPILPEAIWSISVYNAQGYFEKNPHDAYTLNDLTAKKKPDKSVAVQFGVCDGKIANCLPIMNGWNYMVRLYRPRAEIQNGTWKFPEAQSMEAGSRALQ